MVAVVLLTGCGRRPWHEEQVVEPATVGEIPNGSKFGEAVLFGAQPAESDFSLLAGMGFKTVLNLRTETEMAALEFDEEAAARQAGLNYLNIPIGQEEPSEGTLQLISSIIDDEDRHPLFVHCASSNRVGYAWSIYRARRHGLTAEEAIAEGKLAGMRSPILEAWARKNLGGAEATTP
jgi:uncharacterized protein (TIGR01244 family)